MLLDQLEGAGLALGYLSLIVVALGVNHYLLDVQTPGHLWSRITDQNSISGGILVFSAWLGQGAIGFTVLFNTTAGVDGAIIGVIVFSIVGIVAQNVVYFLLNLATGGRLNKIITAPGFNGGALAAAGALLAVSAATCSSIIP